MMLKVFLIINALLSFGFQRFCRSSDKINLGKDLLLYPVYFIITIPLIVIGVTSRIFNSLKTRLSRAQSNRRKLYVLITFPFYLIAKSLRITLGFSSQMFIYSGLFTWYAWKFKKVKHIDIGSMANLSSLHLTIIKYIQKRDNAVVINFAK